MSNYSQSSNTQAQTGDEVSVLDILLFFKYAWKTIALAAVLGLVVAVVYLSILPKQYEATANITMAQIGAASNNNLNPFGANIEEPVLLMARLSLPTSFTPQAIEACGFQNQVNAAEALSKAIKLSAPKGVANIVELKTFGPSPQAAQTCAQALFELIKVSQAQIVAPYIKEVKARIAYNEDRLERAKTLVVKADKSGQMMTANYLSTRDEIRFLLDEISALKNVVSFDENRATHLVAPIYAGDMPIAPKKRIALAGGFFGGLFLGLLIALGRQLVAKLESEMARAA